jgi:NAD-dependent dihydropyrimidine dehydrogenase PreA subunit
VTCRVFKQLAWRGERVGRSFLGNEAGDVPIAVAAGGVRTSHFFARSFARICYTSRNVKVVERTSPRRGPENPAMAASQKSDPAPSGAARITIRTAWCKGCAYCVETCPRGALAMDGVVARVAAPDRCTGCELCVWICPDFAIRIESASTTSPPAS